MKRTSVVFMILAVLVVMAPAAFAQGDTPRGGNIFAPPRLEPTQTKICFVNFCDTMLCAVDQGDNVSCLWDWQCTGTDQEEMLGRIVPHDTANVAGYLGLADLTVGWEIHIEQHLVDLWLWQGVGSTAAIQQNQPFTLNCADGANAPSILESSRF
jgi:hypothetical protein